MSPIFERAVAALTQIPVDLAVLGGVAVVALLSLFYAVPRLRRGAAPAAPPPVPAAPGLPTASGSSHVPPAAGAAASLAESSAPAPGLAGVAPASLPSPQSIRVKMKSASAVRIPTGLADDPGKSPGLPAPTVAPAPGEQRPRQKTAERRALSAEAFAEPPRDPEREQRGGAYVFGKSPEKLSSSAKIDMSYERTETPATLQLGKPGSSEVHRTDTPGSGSPTNKPPEFHRPGDQSFRERQPAAGSREREQRERERFSSSDKIDMRASGKITTASELDFDKWKDKKEKKLVDELQEQNTELTNIITILPGLTKRLSETPKKRELAPLLADMVQRLCMPPPEKVMIFLVSKSKDELVLAAKIGYPEAEEDVATPVKIPRNWGRIGYAIRHAMTMDTKDFERDHIDDPPAATGQFWQTEVAAPLISNKEILGAISVEGFSTYNKNAKKLVYVAANLGALAISLAEKTAQIQHQANVDALTNLFNKRYFFERLDVEIEKARQTGKPLSIFMFDIDHFKKYNDRNGHPAGDEALKITGQLLNERRRESDTAARYGGEEFIVILPDTPKEGAYIFGESFRKIIETYPYAHGDGQPLGKVSISGGVSTFPEDGNGPNPLIEVADECLYRSKEAGRNAVMKRIPKDAPLAK